jgi:glycosyltransferase involved in cell wall biosynthesis
MNNKKTIILMTHKGLQEKNGTSVYLKNMVSVLSQDFNVIVPSESFFEKKIGKTNKWISKVIGINVFLSLWVLKNLGKDKSSGKIIVMEDRYILIPSIMLALLSSGKLITLVSDWGLKYIFSLPVHKLLKYLLSFYSVFFHLLVIKLSTSIITMSVTDKIKISHSFGKPIFVIPYLMPNLDTHVDLNSREANVLFENNEIRAIFVGDCFYPPNMKSVEFLIKEIAPKLYLIDKGVRIIIAGRGTAVFQRNVTKNVTVLGEVESLLPIYNRCHIGINPSKTIGGTSSKNIEYLASGLVVVATRESTLGVIQTNRLIISELEDFAEIIASEARKLRASHRDSIYEEETKRIKEFYSLDENRDLIVKFVNSI